ncbi:MAG: carbohydrate kinase family protein [Nitrospirota bacterium]
MQVAVIGTGTIETVIEVPHLDLAGLKVTYDERAFRGIGGSALNIALRLRAMGIDAIPLFPYGDDEIGRKLVDSIILKDNYSLKIHMLSPIHRATTNESLILVEPTGKKCNISKTGVGQDIFPEMVESWFGQNIERVGAVVISHIRQETAKNPITSTLCKKIRSSRQNVPIFFNPGLSQYQIGLHQYTEVLSMVNVLQLGRDELLVFMGSGPGENKNWIPLFEELLQMMSCLIVTLGESGAIVSRKDGVIYNVPPYQLGRMIRDSTGAGDAFLAGFVYGYLEGKDDVDSLDLARRSAAFACLSFGGVSQIPTKSSLLRLEEKLGNIEPIQVLSYEECLKYFKSFRVSGV